MRRPAKRLRPPSNIGFDDIELAAQVRPSLTSIALPRKDLASRAVERLMQYIEGKDQAAAPEHLLLTPHLVARQSTAPLALAPWLTP